MVIVTLKTTAVRQLYGPHATIALTVAGKKLTSTLTFNDFDFLAITTEERAALAYYVGLGLVTINSDNLAVSELTELASISGAASLATAMCGNMVLSISPATVTPAPVSTAWTRNVVVTLQDSAGNTHTWCNQAFTTTVSIADTSTAGTASIVSTTLTLVNGVATIVVSGDAQDWLDTETDTLTIGSIDIMGYTIAGGTSVETFTA